MCQVIVGGYVPTSLLDWPGMVCASLFTAGCNLRCPFCHNPELVPVPVAGDGPEAFLRVVEGRRAFLDGVCISGGEPCMHRGLGELMARIRSMGLKVKLDTNGTYPEVLQDLLSRGLVDFVALDVKAPWDRYGDLTGGFDVASKVRTSIGIIRSWGGDYELRTTWVPKLLSLEDIKAIRFMLKDDAHWVVQLFRPGRCLDPSLDQEDPASPAPLEEELRGIRVRGIGA
ncbi:anaerobic ribonucleoside-triphosphate reductase activating protein [Thermanaerovibrio acidaminovorans]|uniref:Anaerobic ribonucleoside-triphosphate reductase activating protein n=1 Tax=Thermanaerovibrio acidaminovorans (strain ATCC 49978 / DSM 6589 / Su883) TaxID=525903 RepID=D1B9B7_THEAS|nr:anaerobic ribonucleoside-triphosphate reductase activating protein [Thermanaerovibrio acidaminovorans]ACZ18870.1 anaerobic ribonucleoside-triphosphate reductase activating protein [Thermanaerovibrio acidaminovorans DSM 6589]